MSSKEATSISNNISAEGKPLFKSQGSSRRKMSSEMSFRKMSSDLSSPGLPEQAQQSHFKDFKNLKKIVNIEDHYKIFGKIGAGGFA